LRRRKSKSKTHRDDAALAAEADDRVVGARAAGRGVDDDEDLLVLHEGERLRAEHGVDVDLAEDLLERVEREARELGLDEVRAVLHHDLELAVALGALPLRDEVEHVDLEEKNRVSVYRRVRAAGYTCSAGTRKRCTSGTGTRSAC
jgi:hypothetical protein